LLTGESPILIAGYRLSRLIYIFYSRASRVSASAKPLIFLRVVPFFGAIIWQIISEIIRNDFFSLFPKACFA